MRYTAWIIALFCIHSVAAQQHPENRFPSVFEKRGYELYQEGRFNAAIAQFEMAMQQNPDTEPSGDLLYYHAMSKLRAGHEDAEPFLVSYLENNPNKVRENQANLSLGDFFYDKSKYRRALLYYRKVDQAVINSEDKNRYSFRLGFCYIEKEKYEEARPLLEAVVATQNEYTDFAQYYYGFITLYFKEYDKAYTAFKSITDPKFEKVHFYMAQVLYQLSKFDEALTELDMLNTNKVPKSDVYWLQAKCYYQMKDYAKASEYYLKGDPNMDKVSGIEQYEIAFSLAESGSLSESIPWYRAAGSHKDSLSQIASYQLAKVLLKMKNYREASYAFSEVWRTGYDEELAKTALYNQAKIAVQLGEANSTKLLDKFVRLFPKTAEARDANKLKARLLLNTDKYREAVDILEGMEDLDPTTEEIYQKVTLARGMELFKSRRFEQALELFEKCKKRRANLSFAAQAGYWTAESLLQSGKEDAALNAYKDFINMSNSDKIEEFAYAYYGQGYVFFQRKDYAQASLYFSQFVNKVVKDRYEEKVVHDAYLRLGDCYLMTRELEKSVSSYAYVSGKNGRDADYALFQSGIIYGLLENSAEKISTLKRLVSQYPKSRYTLDGYNEIASEYMLIKNYEGAEKYYTLILDQYPGTQVTRKAYSTLGRIYYNQGKINESVQIYTRLYDEFKGTEDARTAVEMVKSIYTEEGMAKEYVAWASSRGGITESAQDSVLYETAINAYDRGEFKKAISSFESYLEEKPNGSFVIPAQYFMAISYEQNKQLLKALDAYKKVAVANSGDFKEDATLAVLKIYGVDAKCDEILPYLEIIEGLTRSKDIQRRAWKSMMYCYNKSGNQEGLSSIAEKVLEDNSVDNDLKFESQLIVVKNELKSNKTLEMVDKLKNIYEGNDNRFAAEAKYLEADVYLNIDSVEMAKESCYQLIDNYNGYDYWVGKSLILLGDAFAKQDDVFNAKVTWNTLIENFTDEKLVNEAKQRIKDAETEGTEKIETDGE